MRLLIFYLVISLLLPLHAQANEEQPNENGTVSHEIDDESFNMDEDKELIADLELIELLELLENINALASMEDTE